MDADGSDPVKLTDNLPYDDCMDEEYWPTWSNDGSKIAFFVKNVTYCSDYQAYKWEVWIMDVDFKYILTKNFKNFIQASGTMLRCRQMLTVHLR